MVHEVTVNCDISHWKLSNMTICDINQTNKEIEHLKLNLHICKYLNPCKSEQGKGLVGKWEFFCHWSIELLNFDEQSSLTDYQWPLVTNESDWGFWIKIKVDGEAAEKWQVGKWLSSGDRTDAFGDLLLLLVLLVTTSLVPVQLVATSLTSTITTRPELAGAGAVYSVLRVVCNLWCVVCSVQYV